MSGKNQYCHFANGGKGVNLALMLPKLGHFITIFFLIFQGMTPCAEGAGWMVRAFHTEDGLAYSVVRDITLSQDQTTAWMATWGGGVSSLAGSEWETIDRSKGLPSDSVRAVWIEKSGAVWIGTDNGIVLYDRQHITTFSTTNTEGLPDHRIHTIHRIKKTELWFSTVDGYLIATQADLPAGSQRTWCTIVGPEITQGNAIRDVVEDHQGRIWLACSRTGVLVSNDGGATWTQSVPSVQRDSSFHGMTETKNGVIWAVGGKAVLRYNGTWWEGIPVPAEMTTCVASTPEGDLILGTNGGLFVFREGNWDQFILDPEYPQQYIECVAPLADGSIWVGARQGAYRLSPPSWMVYTKTTGNVDLIDDALTARVGCPVLSLDKKGNLVRFENQGWVPLLHLLEGKDLVQAALTTPQEGKVWVLCSTAAYHCDLETPSIKRRVAIPAEIPPRKLYEEPDGTLWLLAENGIFKLQGDLWIPHPTLEASNRNQTYCMEKDDSGGYWFGIEDRVEYWKEGKRIQVFPAEGEMFPGLPPIQSLFKDQKGKLYFATSTTGIKILDGNKWSQISAHEGLLSSRIRSVYKARDGALWVGHRDSWISCGRQGHWSNYRLSEGVPPGSVSYLGESDDGSIWASLERTAIIRYRRDLSPPNTTILSQDTELNPGEVGFFSFGGMDAWNKTETGNLEFSWRIVPVDMDSSETGWSSYSQTNLTLTPRLDPGNYLFQVRAIDLDGNEDPTPASVSLKVLPPLWRQSGFMIPVAFLSLVALLALSIGFRKHLALRKSGERYRNLVDDALTVIIKWNAKGEITFWNEYAERIFGFSREEILGHPVIGSILPEDPWAHAHLDNINQILLSKPSEPVQLHHENIRRDGAGIHMSWTYRPIFSDDGSLLEVHAFGVDTTEQFNAEQALSESEEKYRTLVERASDAIFIVQEGTIKYANPRLAAMLGYSPDETVGLALETFIHEIERERIISNYYRRSAGEDLPSSYETAFVDKQGRRIDVEIRVGLISYQGRQATFVLAHDITQRKAAQEAAMRSSRMEATATLAGGIAHDFNNLMVGVLGYTDLLRVEFQDREDVMRMLDRIGKSAERAGELARQMLAYARGGKYQPRKIDLNKIIRDTLKMLARDIPDRIHLESILANDLPAVVADPAQMTEVIAGLLNNAVEAIAEKGTIVLETGSLFISSSSEFGDTALLPGPYVCLTVTDSGSGMDSATLTRIFEPFFTTKFQGRGLGLSAVYGIAKNHGGEILAYSEKGRGSIFKVFIPAKET